MSPIPSDPSDQLKTPAARGTVPAGTALYPAGLLPLLGRAEHVRLYVSYATRPEKGEMTALT